MIDLPKEVLKLWKLRSIISKAWIPMGISKEEAVDVLLWCIGEDVTTLHISEWPIRIMIKTGVKFDVKTTPMIDVMRAVAKVWQSKKKFILTSNFN